MSTVDSDSDNGLSKSASEASDTGEVESEESDNDANTVLAQNWYPISTDEINPAPDSFPFSGTPGCKFKIENNSDILEYFQLFFDDNLISLLVTEANRYAGQSEKSTKKTSPIAEEEMQIFLAIIVLQGIIGKPEERMYWSTNEIFSTPIFPRLMPLKRYLNIKINLHFSNTEDNPVNHPNPKLSKIWPVFDIINKKCSSLYVPEKDITIDQSIMPMKLSHCGIKLYYLCESKTGYLHNLLIYAGKGSLFSDKYEDQPRSVQVALSLLNSLLGMGYCLTTTKLFTSLQLSEILITEKTDIFGAIRMSRKEIPLEIREKNLIQGEMIAFQLGNVMIMKYQGKKDICLLSTIHNPELTATNKTDKDGNNIMKPKLVHDYHDAMKGIEQLNQHLHNRKLRGKHYRQIFFHLLDICLWNSFILYLKNGGTKDNLDFRKTLVTQLIEKYHSSNFSKISGRPRQPGPLRLTERHFPMFVPPTEKKLAPCRYCAVCCKKRDSNGKKRRRETRYFCGSCNVGLCAVPCFGIYHSQINFVDTSSFDIKTSNEGSS